MTFSALILAGGKSSRMGCDEALLPFGQESLLERQIRLAREAGAIEVFVSGRGGLDYSRFGCHVLKDQFRDGGPLAGIERGLTSISTPMLLVLAVDLPLMCSECLHRILPNYPNWGAIPIAAGQIEPLAAFYPKRARPLAVPYDVKTTELWQPLRLFASVWILLNLSNYQQRRRYSSPTVTRRQN
jgi:molybdopterin-guanine dinucleotide biosynthesis protein A